MIKGNIPVLTMIDKPLITVIMPVFNSVNYIKNAIQSILNQSFYDFEFIIINDGSTDGTHEVIKSFNDRRIINLNNSTNIGNYPSRNKGIQIAKGKYICVMDADDIALLTRFERQLKFMEENPEIGIAGSGFRYYGNEKDIFREYNYEKIKVILLRNNCFIHPSLIIRHEFLKKYNLQYDEKYYYSSDYDFIVRASRFFHITNIPEVLLNYRIHEDQITTKNRQRQSEYAKEIVINQLKYLGINPSANEIMLNMKLINGVQIEYQHKNALDKWIEKILEANLIKGYYDIDELESFFTSLRLMQSFCHESCNKLTKLESTGEETRYDLMDVTFLIRSRIDSPQQVENLNTFQRFVIRYFNTVVLIIEIDSEQHYFPDKISENIHYSFIKDSNEIFHKTWLANKTILMADTPYVAIWDVDSICLPEQIIEAVNELRTGNVVLCYPYDGRFYICENLVSNLFKQTERIEILSEQIPVMKLMHGYHSSRGACIVNKDKYMEAGGDNENIYGWVNVGDERLKRVEKMGLSVGNSKGPLFKLWHPYWKNERFESQETEKGNLKEFLKTCSIENRINN